MNIVTDVTEATLMTVKIIPFTLSMLLMAQRQILISV